MNDSAKGFVYILTNDAFREDWVKIGKSSRPVDVRSKELDNTAVPLPFNIYATLQTAKFSECERIIHRQIDRLTDLRIRQNREFFNVHPAQALDILLDLASAFDDAVVLRYDEDGPTQLWPPVQAAPEKQKEKGQKTVTRSPFRFSMVGLSIGDTITFDPLGLEVKVATDNKVEHEGRLWSLSAFTDTFMPEDQQNTSGSYQGPKFFSYGGKSLWELRLEREEKMED